MLQILALTPFLISGTLDVGNNALDMSKKEIIDDAFYILLWAPLVETIVFQLACYELSKKFLRKFQYCVLSALLFGMAHLATGMQSAISATAAGMVWAYSYATWRDASVFKSLCITWALHAIRNGLALTIGFLAAD
ncbi:hypothetical protein JCM19000A_00750 [Silvimonas sp. JCM 19000]